MSNIDRRTFIKSSLAAGAAFTVFDCSTKQRPSGRIIGANDRLRIAVAGVHGQGTGHINGWLSQDNVELAYLIDPDENVLAEKLAYVKEKTGDKFACKGVSDIRKALDDKTLDAISIATPNHWHSLMTIWAAQAGKHVYVEKPMSHDILEGRVVVEAQKKYGVVIQHGTQNRSNPKIAGLHELIHAGKFGKLKISYGYCCKPRGTIGFQTPCAPPPNLDWNLWRGPALIDAYHNNYVHYNWHWFWESGNGDMNNQGTHQLDVAYWAIDKNQTHPVRVMALGGRFQWNDQGETPNTMLGIAEYPNGQYVYFNVRNVNYEGYQRQVENEYYFEDGGKIIREKYYPKGISEPQDIDIPDGHVTPGGQWGSFIAACRANNPKMANGNALDAHYSSVLGHLMNNSYRLGKGVPFNAKAGSFGENTDASEHFMNLHETMSKGVGVTEEENQYIVGPWLTFDSKKECHTGEFAHEANELLKNANRPDFQVPDAKHV